MLLAFSRWPSSSCWDNLASALPGQKKSQLKINLHEGSIPFDTKITSIHPKAKLATNTTVASDRPLRCPVPQLLPLEHRPQQKPPRTYCQQGWSWISTWLKLSNRSRLHQKRGVKARLNKGLQRDRKSFSMYRGTAQAMSAYTPKTQINLNCNPSFKFTEFARSCHSMLNDIANSRGTCLRSTGLQAICDSGWSTRFS